MHNPERTVSLVKDVAECLDKIAVGPQHTPALYATFLRALIEARPKTTQTDSPPFPAATLSSATANIITSDSIFQNAIPETLFLDPSFPHNFFDSSHSQDLSEELLSGFTSSIDTPRPGRAFFSTSTVGEMGPIMDGSIFPPVPMPPPANPTTHEELANMLSMDSILSPSFWDNILIPGKSA